MDLIFGAGDCQRIRLLACCSSRCVYMENAALRLCVWPRSWEEGPFEQLAYSTTMCLLDSPLVCPSGPMR